MKKFKLILTAVLYTISSSTHAVLVDNGKYITDTVNNVEWLNLTFTDGLYFSQALNAANATEGGGWTYANQKQISSMWYRIFPADWNADAQGSIYANEVIQFEQLFGATGSGNAGFSLSYGLYRDDVGAVRMVGVSSTSFYDSYNAFGPENTRDIQSIEYYGIFLVRSTVVPVPAALWLFGTGLISLIAVAKRKSCT